MPVGVDESYVVYRIVEDEDQNELAPPAVIPTAFDPKLIVTRIFMPSLSLSVSLRDQAITWWPSPTSDIFDYSVARVA